jgi:serralysin
MGRGNTRLTPIGMELMNTGEGEATILAYLNIDERGGSALGKPSKTLAAAANDLIGGEAGWGGILGGAFSVTYGFRTSAPNNMPSDTVGFSRFGPDQIRFAELALTAWSDAGNITFIRVGEGALGEEAFSNQAAILFANYSAGVEGAAAFAMYPGSTLPSSPAGDVWVNISRPSNQTLTQGSSGVATLIHEIGHAIGLGHPGAYDVITGTNITYQANAEYYEDSRQYTVMSYFAETNTGGNYGGRYPAAPQLDDIRAIQMEYGANMTTRTGDTVYGFGSNADRPWFQIAASTDRAIFAIWDAGGNDTLDFSAYAQDQFIELRAGYFSNVGGLVGNVAVADGAVIENAIGGSGSDGITGNAAANRLEGRAGNDRLFGREGDDSLDGGNGTDYLRGDEGNDQLTGGAAFDDLNGNAGNDTVSGGAGDDWVVGGKDNDLLDGGEGSDLVLGNLGNDWLDGANGDDVIRGGQANDTLLGQAGNDWMSGDRGDDTLTGGAGADIFHSFGDAGIDQVTDFNLSEGDRVLLDPGSEWTVSQLGQDVVIQIGGGAQVILVGIALNTLTGDWISAA